MSADVNEQSEILALLVNDPHKTMILKESIFISVFLGSEGFEQVAPEEVGALTGAALISDGNDIFGDMQYAVRNFLEELAAGNTVTWQKG